MSGQHKDIVSDERHPPIDFETALNESLLSKDASGFLTWILQSDFAGAPGSISIISVVDIDDPTELNGLNNLDDGEVVVVRQILPGTNQWTIYVYDSNVITTEDSPFIMNTSSGGTSRWIAIGGKFTTQGVRDVTGDRLITVAEIAKLLGIETGAEVNQTDAEIKTQYENNANTNEYSDAEKSKLGGLESSKFLGEFASLGALQTAFPSPAVGSYANVDAGVGQDVERYVWDTDDAAYVRQLGVSSLLTNAQIKTQYESNLDTNAFQDAEKSKLAGIESGATADQSDAEIKTAYENNANTNEFSDAEKTKLEKDLPVADAQYAMNADVTQVNTGRNTVGSWVTNLSSFFNNLISKPNLSEFQMDFDGEIEISFNIEIGSNNNNSGAAFGANLNGTPILETESYVNTRNNNSESHTASLPPIKVPVSDGDVISFDLIGRENNTYTAFGTRASWARIKVLRVN